MLCLSSKAKHLSCLSRVIWCNYSTSTMSQNKKDDAKQDASILSTANEKGEYVRQPSSFRNWISINGSTGFKAEAGRYHLYVSYACPWAHRTLITRKLKGLTDVITVDVVDYHNAELGWKFNPKVEGATPDTVFGFTYLRDVYFKVDPNYDGRISVPVLFDKQKETIVNNESAEIIRMLNSEFNEFSATPEAKAIDLYPAELRQQIDEVNEWIYS